MVISRRSNRIEGYAIVSEDGMLANSAGVMPDSLKVKADQEFFEKSLDGVDVVVHGRHSHEHQRHSDLRRRLILTRKIAGLGANPYNKKALFWNPAGVSFEKPWRYWEYRKAVPAASAERRSLHCFWINMIFSIFHACRLCVCQVGDRYFLKCPRKLQKKCLRVTG